MGMDELPEGTGWFRIVASLAEHRRAFTEILEDTGVANGTAQRRLEELQEMGWVHETPEIKDGRAVKMYFIDGTAYAAMQEYADRFADTDQRGPDDG